MVKLEFWKMHGLGNDYIVIDNRYGELGEKELPGLARKLCRRRFFYKFQELLFFLSS